MIRNNMKNHTGYFAGVDRDPDNEWEILLSYCLDKCRGKETLYPKQLTEKGK